MTIDDASVAAQSLAEALAIITSLRGREPRERHRELLARAIEQAERAAASGAAGRALSVLARAHAARAEDALHGARQLSLSAQRAPTAETCDEGWTRVESLVAAAALAARAAERVQELAGDAPIAASRAAAAARAARRLLEERNHAYTFHTDAGFSFGEGWYVAAAALLAGVAIQIEPGKPGVAQAERFLRDAGLSHRVQPYRSRPRANKQTTDIVARAFRADASGAQKKLRAAFLGSAPIAAAVRDFIDSRLASLRDHAKVLVWIRDGKHHPGRNTVFAEVVEIAQRMQNAGICPVLVGDALRGGPVPADAADMTLFWKDPVFRGDDGRRAQLQFFEHLREAHGVVGQLGVTTAGMDGPALMGMPTLYLTETTNVRMRAWVGAVPRYRELVRERGYLDRVSEWLTEATTASAADR
jgi:hypothetical protein